MGEISSRWVHRALTKVSPEIWRMCIFSETRARSGVKRGKFALRNRNSMANNWQNRYGLMAGVWRKCSKPLSGLPQINCKSAANLLQIYRKQSINAKDRMLDVRTTTYIQGLFARSLRALRSPLRAAPRDPLQLANGHERM